MLTDSAVIGFFTDEVVLARIDGKKDSALSKKYHVSAYPTLVMVDREGREIDRLVGYMPPDAFLGRLRNYRRGIGTLSDLLRRAEAGNTDRRLFFEIADKYKYRGGDSEAVKWYQKVIDAGDPKDSLTWESRMALADLYRRGKEYDRAIAAYGSIMNDFKGTGFGADAEIWRAYVLTQKGDTAAAIRAFEGFIEHYPQSEDVEYANRQIAKLKKVEENK